MMQQTQGTHCACLADHSLLLADIAEANSTVLARIPQRSTLCHAAMCNVRHICDVCICRDHSPRHSDALKHFPIYALESSPDAGMSARLSAVLKMLRPQPAASPPSPPCPSWCSPQSSCCRAQILQRSPMIGESSLMTRQLCCSIC